MKTNEQRVGRHACLTVMRTGSQISIIKSLPAQSIIFLITGAMSSIRGYKRRDDRVIVTGNVNVMRSDKKTRVPGGEEDSSFHRSST